MAQGPTVVPKAASQASRMMDIQHAIPMPGVMPNWPTVCSLARGTGADGRPSRYNRWMGHQIHRQSGRTLRLIRSLLCLRGLEQYLDSESPALRWIGGQEVMDGVSSPFNPGLSLGGGECRRGVLVGQQSLVMQSVEGIG